MSQLPKDVGLDLPDAFSTHPVKQVADLFEREPSLSIHYIEDAALSVHVEVLGVVAARDPRARANRIHPSRQAVPSGLRSYQG